jgi:hypothetical protein
MGGFGLVPSFFGTTMESGTSEPRPLLVRKRRDGAQQSLASGRLEFKDDGATGIVS